MQKTTIALLVGALLLVAGGAVLVPRFLEDDDVPIAKWSRAQEQEVAESSEAESAVPATEPNVERSAVALAEGGSEESRIDVILRGRVIDKFQAPVAEATVWLDFGRGGPRGGNPGGNRTRRVPDPVQTDREGRFAFQGQTFRNLRVSLQVAHRTHAPGLFDKDLGEVKAETDLGDLMLTNGGEVIGRITDLEGNGIAAAAIRLSPENGNRMRMVRNRDNLLGELQTDTNGYYRAQHVAAGDWSLSATAKMHTEGHSPTFAVEEDQPVELEDIRLGPGFEVTGYVRSTPGQPIAKAEVTLRSQAQNRGDRGGRGGRGPGGGNEDWRGGGGREHTATTDEQGRFFLEHLPGVPMRVEVRAEGYLDYDQDQVDITLGQVLQITMQDGLRIAGVVSDAVDGQRVLTYAVRAVRIRGLPVPGQANVDVNALMAQMRDGNLDEATRTQARQQLESLRGQFGDMRRGGGPGGGPGRGGDRQDNGGGPGNWGGFARDLGKPEQHPDGAYVVTGLQEGVYEVHVQSPDHARFRSAEVEVRKAAPPPTADASLDRGVFVAGVVRSTKGDPVQGARVELRTASANDANGPGRRRGRGGNAQPGNPAGNGAGGNDPANGQDFAAMGRDFMRQAQGAMLVLEATTDAEGGFVVKHVPRGTYRLQAQAKGFATTTGDPFDLQADRSDFDLQVGPLGSLAGKVRGLGSGEIAEAHVAVVPIGGNGGFGGMRGMMGRGGPGGQGGGNGPFQSTTVHADGSYLIEDLTPGTYLVRSWVGSPQDLMRELGPQFFAGSLQPDVTIRGGERSTLDLAVTRPQVGLVAGTVTHNGLAPVGFQIELTRTDDATNDNANGAAADRQGRGMGGGPGGFGGRGGMFGGRSFQAAVAGSGHFQIKDVPAGEYRLRVQSTRRGGTLYEEKVNVVANATTERNLQITTASVRGTVTCADAAAKDLQGSVTLVPGLSALPDNWNQWRRDPGNRTFDARVQGGAFQFETLTPGNYLMVLSIRGRERTTAPVSIGPGDGQAATIEAGKISAAPAAGAPTPGGRQQRPGGGANGGVNPQPSGANKR